MGYAPLRSQARSSRTSICGLWGICRDGWFGRKSRKSFAVGVRTFVGSGGVITDRETVTLGETLTGDGWASLGDGQKKGRGEKALDEHGE
jgi:hypothetical protein